jgi:uncharacterized protein
MKEMSFEIWEDKISSWVGEHFKNEDAAHDILHFKRVLKTAKRIGHLEDAEPMIIIPSVWLHDIVNVPKNHRLRNKASNLSAEKAINVLTELGYPKKYFDGIYHAIEAHSFSANIETLTIEAKVIQDADRLDGLGAIGIARCFATAGVLNRKFYSQEDPFCHLREPDDQIYTLDHFFRKLFKLEEGMKTNSGRIEAKKRVKFMEDYIAQLKIEII